MCRREEFKRDCWIVAELLTSLLLREPPMCISLHASLQKRRKFQKFHQLHLKYNHKYHHCHKYPKPSAKKKELRKFYKSSRREIDVCSDNLICERDHGDMRNLQDFGFVREMVIDLKKKFLICEREREMVIFFVWTMILKRRRSLEKIQQLTSDLLLATLGFMTEWR